MKDARLLTIQELNDAAVDLDKRTREIIDGKYAEILAGLLPVRDFAHDNLNTSHRWRMEIKGFPWKISMVG